MRIDRRNVLGRALLGVLAGTAIALAPVTAPALSEDEAASFVRETIEQVAELVDSEADRQAKAERLREIMEQRAAMPEISRFVAGTAWRAMNEDQKERFVSAFTKFISGVYAGKFQKYSVNGDTRDAYKIGQVVDAGSRGVLVKTRIERPDQAKVLVEWLVSDKPGRPVIADIVIEGVSLLVTEREEIGSMFEKRGGDVEKLIEHLESARA